MLPSICHYILPSSRRYRGHTGKFNRSIAIQFHHIADAYMLRQVLFVIRASIVEIGVFKIYKTALDQHERIRENLLTMRFGRWEPACVRPCREKKHACYSMHNAEDQMYLIDSGIEVGQVGVEIEQKAGSWLADRLLFWCLFARHHRTYALVSLSRAVISDTLDWGPCRVRHPLSLCVHICHIETRRTGSRVVSSSHRTFSSLWRSVSVVYHIVISGSRPHPL